MMTLDVQTEVFPEPGTPLAQAWAGLAARCGAPVFCGPVFQGALRTAFGGVESSVCITARAPDGTLRAVLPVQRRRVRYHRLPVREIGFFRNPHALRNAVLIDPTCDRRPTLAALIRGLRNGGPMDTLYLDNLSDTPDDTDLAALGDAGLRAAGWEPGRLFRHAVLPTDWETYQASRSGNFRRQQRKFRRLAADRGPVIAERLDTRAAILSGLEVLDRIEAASWQGQDPATAMTDADRLFMRRLAETLDETQLGDLWLLRVGEHPVAALRMLADPGRRYVHTMHFDQACGDFAPGALLFEHMMRDAIERGLLEVDFHGDSRFFRRWSTGVRAACTVRAFPRSIRGLALFAARQATRARRRQTPDGEAES